MEALYTDLAATLNWKEHDGIEATFSRFLEDLKREVAPPATSEQSP